ncbi:DUF2969 family protein [Oenococcus alcoholitolerans]|uniref:DUF2969 domain-containing protein n=1 Tax=Oenococcus alcoholitolerans TaxID=931074 RepID=A0ABR4XRE9_9LACO|nr:hypothetical protein Q757_03285 [Oenococcus alcoholitolerans]
MSGNQKQYQVEIVEEGDRLSVRIGKQVAGSVSFDKNSGQYQATNFFEKFIGDFKKEDQAVMAVISSFNLRQA